MGNEPLNRTIGRVAAKPPVVISSHSSPAEFKQRRGRDADVPVGRLLGRRTVARPTRRNPSMHDAALKTFKSSVLAACCLLALVRAAPAEEKRPASPASGQAAVSTTPDQGVREAATRAVQLIDRTSANFLTTRACFTCHTQTLSAIVLRDGRRVGIEVDEANFKRQYERAFEDSMFGGVRVDTVGYALWALDVGQHAPNEKTEQLAGYLLSYQKELGVWKTIVSRPPAEASNFTTNYVAIRGLNRYGNATQREAIATRTTAVKQWLESANAVDTEDQVFRLRLAQELKLPPDKVDGFVRELLSEQDVAGGWAQERGMKPDAYATGSVLVALHEAGGLPCRHSAWLRGLGYLLRTQKADGSWHVVSRAKPLQEYFESGFPHGKDQLISAFATGWATEALLMSLAQERR